MNSTARTGLIHLGLFILTIATTTFAGAEWTFGKTIFVEGYSWADFATGLPYSLSLIGILAVHEFGHYFTARYHHIRATLPYFIPMPWFIFQVGTMGAIIRLKDHVSSKQKHFDIGIAGPLAGFVVAMGVLWYGFTHLPPPEYIFQVHPDYAKYGLDYAKEVYKPELLQKSGTIDIAIGKNLIYRFFEIFVADPARLPNAHEIMHYPYLFAGFLSLIFTSINLLPIGQLDGGHVLYGLVGFRRHRIIASTIFILLVFFSGLGLVSPGDPSRDLMWEIPMMLMFIYLCMRGLKWSPINTIMTTAILFAVQYLLKFAIPAISGFPTWMPFAFLIGRFIGVQHPIAEDEEPLSSARKILGILALLIFILSFAPDPIY